MIVCITRALFHLQSNQITIIFQEGVFLLGQHPFQKTNGSVALATFLQSPLALAKRCAVTFVAVDGRVVVGEDEFAEPSLATVIIFLHLSALIGQYNED